MLAEWSVWKSVRAGRTGRGSRTGAALSAGWRLTFSQRWSFPDSVEDECCSGDVADPAGAEGDVLEGAPALFEFGCGTFSEGADGSDQVVRGARVRMQGLLGAALGAPDRDKDADAGADVALVGECG